MKLTFAIRTIIALLLNLATIKSNLMKNGSKSEAQYQPCLAIKASPQQSGNGRQREEGKSPKLILAMFQQF